MRIVCVSDLHENLIDIPECDLLLLAGDISYAFRGALADKHAFLLKEFHAWVELVPAEEVVIVAGNHDQSIEKWGFPNVIKKWRSHYLQDEAIELFGLKIWGSPWQPYFFNWAFNAPERHGEEFLAEKYKAIPDDTDIIVSHGPPHGFGDLNTSRHHVGSEALRFRIEEVKPKLVACGHIHEAYGEYDFDGVRVVNCSVVNSSYKPAHPPVVIDL